MQSLIHKKNSQFLPTEAGGEIGENFSWRKIPATWYSWILLYIKCFNAPVFVTGLGIVISTQPPSGTLIANFEGTENATTLICNIGNGADQISTSWSIENFRGDVGLQDITSGPEPFIVTGDPIPSVPQFTFLNELTISNWTSDLDGAIVYCGTGQDRREASFILRVYRKSLLS